MRESRKFNHRPAASVESGRFSQAIGLPCFSSGWWPREVTQLSMNFVILGRVWANWCWVLSRKYVLLLEIQIVQSKDCSSGSRCALKYRSISLLTTSAREIEIYDVTSSGVSCMITLTISGNMFADVLSCIPRIGFFFIITEEATSIAWSRKTTLPGSIPHWLSSKSSVTGFWYDKLPPNYRVDHGALIHCGNTTLFLIDGNYTFSIYIVPSHEGFRYADDRRVGLRCWCFIGSHQAVHVCRSRSVCFTAWRSNKIIPKRQRIEARVYRQSMNGSDITLSWKI